MRFATPRGAVAGADMTPMIDIVFQLIAFFMIVTNFEQTQADERVKLPADELARPPAAPRQNEVVVNIGFLRDAQGNKIDPQPYIFALGDKQIPVLQYGAQLKNEVRVARYKGLKPSDLTIVIRADSETPTGLVQELIKLAQEVGIEKFALKAMADDEVP